MVLNSLELIQINYVFHTATLYSPLPWHVSHILRKLSHVVRRRNGFLERNKFVLSLSLYYKVHNIVTYHYHWSSAVWYMIQVIFGYFLFTYMYMDNL